MYCLKYSGSSSMFLCEKATKNIGKQWCAPAQDGSSTSLCTWVWSSSGMILQGRAAATAYGAAVAQACTGGLQQQPQGVGGWGWKYAPTAATQMIPPLLLIPPLLQMPPTKLPPSLLCTMPSPLPQNNATATQKFTHIMTIVRHEIKWERESRWQSWYQKNEVNFKIKALAAWDVDNEKSNTIIYPLDSACSYFSTITNSVSNIISDTSKHDTYRCCRCANIFVRPLGLKPLPTFCG